MVTTSITIRNEYGTYTVEINRTECDIEEMTDMFINVMTAATYSREGLIESMKNVSE